jgi:hypothetical protein
VAHLLNYRKHPLKDVRIHCPAGRQLRMLALTPDCNRLQPGPKEGEWLIPSLGVYSMVVVE